MEIWNNSRASKTNQTDATNEQPGNKNEQPGNKDKQTDATKEQTDTTKEQTDTTKEQTDTTKKQSDAKEEQPGNKDKQSGNKNEQPDTEQKKAPTETSKTPAKTPKPRVIQYNIDGKKIYISSKDWQHFNELRAQLASGTTLNDDLITKMKPILEEVRLQDGTKIFNDKTKLSQLDDIMKHYPEKEISSFDDLLEFVLRKIR